MAKKTSINIKPCNVRSSGPHNRRTAEYLANIRKEKIYVRTDLMAKNEEWVAPELGETTLEERNRQIAAMVKEKTGRAMQTKDRERVNKKTGKVTIVRGSTPIKEGVVVIKEDTTMEQLQHFCEVCKERWGITPLQIFIHRDEGHYVNPGETATWKPNLHAHIVWDWMNHDTGKSCKLNEKAMSEMQTVLAECLEMERGTSKKMTGKEHLERNDYIIAKQKQEAERAKAEKKAAQAERDAVIRETDKAKAEQEKIQAENEEKQRRSAELDSEIADKKEQVRKADRENTDNIKSGIANLLGKGKYAAIEKENQELKQSVPREKERLQKLFTKQLKEEIIKRTKELDDREVELKRQHGELRLKYNTLVDKYNAARQADRETEKRLKWRDAVLYCLAKSLYKVSEIFKRVIDGIINFARSACSSGGHRDILYNEEAAGIKNIMDTYADTEDEKIAIGNWLVGFSAIKGGLSEQEENRAKKEVDDVAKGQYDWRLERENSNGIQR